ncbi:hypothetical protein K435DRAFT_888883 [Dendrothele bispora CBS 962.96]|uniref:Uncharacterized protein n=1 Tax=Dendrothele bispora (strain CBS 962.96) TaxID=1314807 RepID=A0A4S8M6R3_DENBC|nr:hypothetical protein K435DRAFT_888883 [Dendrothele bispora CBS 962.96]
MDFQNIKRVILWREPPSFLSLVQKIGRCVRRLSQCGEAIVLVTKSAYTQHLLNLETDGKEVNIEDDLDDDIIQEPIQAQIDRIEVIDWEDPEVNGDDDEPMGAVTGRRKVGGKKGAISAVAARDRKYLSYFLATSECRRIPWDEFFCNADKLLLFVRPPNAQCCDNCQPELFPIETVAIRYPYPSRARRAVKPSMELQDAIRSALHQWRATAIEKHYAGQTVITGRYILSDDVIDRIAERPRVITDISVFRYVIPWGLGVANPSYAEEVVQTIHEQVALHPDPIQLAREEAAQEQANKKLEATAEKERYERLRQVFQGCYDAVYGEKTGDMVARG